MENKSIIVTELEKVFREVNEDKYFTKRLKDEVVINESINKSVIIEDLNKYDNNLVLSLINNKIIKKQFVVEIQDINILQIDRIILLLEVESHFRDSVTNYKNEIGLSSNSQFISENNNVVIDFPYKDAVLKGSMQKEEIINEKNALENFYHEILNKEEIDRLFDEKILFDVKKYDKNGFNNATTFSYEDNLIIRGNNLIALNSIKNIYKGKVKFITIDPPYYFRKKKASDAFKYNSNFKLSTWLVFMKNRLEAASELLSDKGIISIIVGEDGYAHLKVLCDEIFKNENYITTIAWRKTDNQSNVGEFANVKDYILLYKKSELAKLGNLPLSEKAIKEYSYEDERGKYGRGVLKDEVRGRYNYTIQHPSGKNVEGPWMISESEFYDLLDKNLVHWPETGLVPRSKIYLEDQLNKGQIPSDFWDASYGTNQRGSDEMKELFGERAFDFPKPEKLLMNLISIGSNKGDIVLDFFMGSGTTQAVALKMGRIFIGIEQMDYIDTISVPRLMKVVDGEQGGISKDVEWNGGGSFVYAKMLNDSINIVEKIMQAENKSNILDIITDAIENNKIKYHINIENVIELINSDKIELDHLKDILIETISKNQLYCNYSEIDDSSIRVLLSDEDYSFNKNFYKLEE